MSQLTVQEIALLETITDSEPNTALSRGHARKPANSKAAIRRCVAAWESLYAEYMSVPEKNILQSFAELEAGKAYCHAMPMLDGYNGVREFIACAAHGILIGAIPLEMRGHILYSARVALSIVQNEPEPPQSRRA